MSRPATGRLLIAAPVIVIALAACGGGSGGSTGTAAGAPTSAAAGGGAGSGAAGAGGPGARQAPGVSGQTAQISGNTLQVRTTDGQTAVEFSASTRITELKAATVASVTVGSCVVAAGQPDAAGTGVSAQTVTVSPAVNGSCSAVDTGFGRGGFGAGRTGRPSASPGQGGTGQGGTGQGGVFATASGRVSAVTPTAITVTGRLRAATRGAGGSPGASPGASPADVTVTVELGTATRYTATAVVASSALAVGQCVTALGQPNDIGTVTARSITIRPAGPTGCATGFGGNGGNGRRGASASPSGTTGV